MGYFYSKYTGGFYNDDEKSVYEDSINGWPNDAVAISDYEYQEILGGQAKGKQISINSDGKVILISPQIDWLLLAEQHRENLLSAANAATADWRTELQLDVISEDDKPKLIKWMAYIKVLKNLDISSVNNQEDFDSVTWPEQPV